MKITISKSKIENKHKSIFFCHECGIESDEIYFTNIDFENISKDFMVGGGNLGVRLCRTCLNNAIKNISKEIKKQVLDIDRLEKYKNNPRLDI